MLTRCLARGRSSGQDGRMLAQPVAALIRSSRSTVYGHFDSLVLFFRDRGARRVCSADGANCRNTLFILFFVSFSV